jgi:hypothetical protein
MQNVLTCELKFTCSVLYSFGHCGVNTMFTYVLMVLKEVITRLYVTRFTYVLMTTAAAMRLSHCLLISVSGYSGHHD